jgi:pimeloyl-ACP methyl ester carboxylesterase
MLAATVFLVVATPGRPSRVAAQEYRPVLLIGGTLVPQDFSGSSFRVPPNGVLVYIEGWRELIDDWLVGELGYFPSEIYRTELARQESEPPNWSLRPPLYESYSWDIVKQTLADNGLSTAGLGSMNASVVQVAGAIDAVLAHTGAAQIDVIGHSQSGVIARAAVRYGVEHGLFTAQEVRKVISLGGVHYGIPTVSPELFGSFGWMAAVAGWFTSSFLENCRDRNLIPVCSDIIRTGNSATRGLINIGAEQTLQNPFGYWSPSGRVNFSYVSSASFYPYYNVPSSLMVLGPTQYVHVYSRNYDGGTIGLAEQAIPERHRLPTQYGNVTNINLQDVCGKPGLQSHHNLEWQDPTVRTVLAHELGFTSYYHDEYCEDPVY